MAGELVFDLAGFSEARAERNAYLACAVLIFYEHVIQLGTEIELFWKQRWSPVKCLFLWSRYYSLLFNVSNAFIFLQPRPPENLCSKFFRWQNPAACIQILTSHIILELRLYAMYDRKRWVLGLFIFLTLGEAITMGIIFGLPNDEFIATNQPFLGLFICADADPPGSHWIAYYWVALISIESTYLVLAVYKAWVHRSANAGSPLMRRLSRDSVLYFIALFGIYIANCILWFKNRITLNELGTAASWVLATIIANRLLTTVRESDYRRRNATPDPDVLSHTPSIHFRREVASGDAAIELETFDRGEPDDSTRDRKNQEVLS